MAAEEGVANNGMEAVVVMAWGVAKCNLIPAEEKLNYAGNVAYFEK